MYRHFYRLEYDKLILTARDFQVASEMFRFPVAQRAVAKQHVKGKAR
jgi:hypothetical protein